MQADAWFIKDVEDTHQAGPDLRCQADALCLATGEAARGAVEGEVAESDIAQESQSRAHFLEDRTCDCPGTRTEGRFQVTEECIGLKDGPGDGPRDVVVTDRHAATGRFQSCTFAGRARPAHRVAFDLLLDGCRLGLGVASLEVGDHPFEGDACFADAPDAPCTPATAGASAGGSVQDEGQLILGEGVHGLFHGEAGCTTDGGHKQQGVTVTVVRPRRDGPFLERKVAVRDHEVGIDLKGCAEASAVRAGAVRTVEAETARLGRVEGDPARHASELLGEQEVVGPRTPFADTPVDPAYLPDPSPDAGGGRRGLRDGGGAGGGYHVDEYLTGCKLEGGLQGIGKAVAKVRPGDEAVNDDLDVMDALGVYLGNLINGVDGAVNPDAGESSGAGVINDRLALALASAPDRGKQDQARAGGQGGNGVNHLRDGLRLDATPALGAMGNTDAGVEEAQVVVDFGNGADRRSWVARYGLLVDGDGG